MMKRRRAEMKRILIQKWGVAADTLAFNTTFLVSNTNYAKFDRPVRRSSNRYLELVGGHGEAVVRNVLDLLGIVSVVITPYQIRVEKGGAFDWTWEGIDLKAEILKAIADAFGDVSVRLS
jgi:hypothetical protein